MSRLQDYMARLKELGIKLSNDEKERNPWIRAFRKVHPDWRIESIQPRCPECFAMHGPDRKIGSNYCRQHRWAYEKWLGRIGVAMLSIKDHKLDEELRSEGLLSPTKN